MTLHTGASASTYTLINTCTYGIITTYKWGINTLVLCLFCTTYYTNILIILKDTVW